MNEKDLIQRFVFENISVRGEIVRLNETYQTITTQHHYPPVVRNLIGETLVITSLLSAIVKFKGRLTVQFQGKSKLKMLLAQCDNEFHMRALADVRGEITKEELADLLKEGLMVITIDPDKGGNRYQGVVSWQGRTLAESIEGYFKDSEQLPTRVWIAVDDKQAVGLLLQVLPEGTSKPKYGDNDWDHLLHLTDTVTPDELLGWDNVTLLSKLYAEEEVRVFAPEPVSFRCNCSVERSENALLLLGREEAEAELKDKQKIVVTCEFCSKEYVFDRVDVAEIFSKKGDGHSSSQIH